MSVARRRYSPDEKKKILSLHEQGYSYQDIADKVRPGVKNAWRSIGDIVRESKKQKTKPPQPVDILDNPTKQRPPMQLFAQSKSSVTLPESLQDSVMAKEIMAMLDDEQRTIFVATYEDLRGEADEESLTKAENEMLCRASLASTQYLRAAKMYSQCESFLIADLNGEIVDDADPRKRMAGRGDAYKKEMETKHKEYMELIDGLKLKRSQRLDKIKDTRNTFLDLQTELMQKVRQESLVEEIKRINMATKDELVRMSKGGEGPDGQHHHWLIGAFEEFTNEEDTTVSKQPSPERDSKKEGGSSAGELSSAD